MITQYHRPDTKELALSLLSRKQPKTVVLAGGTRLSQYRGEPIEVVDIQALHLDSFSSSQDGFTIGAGARLADIESWHGLPEAYRLALRREGTINLRQTATAGGTLLSASGTSLFACAALAADALLIWEPGAASVSYGDWLAMGNSGLLLSEIRLPASVEIRVESVERSPLDVPFLSVSVARWKSGRLRVVMGSSSAKPMLIADGNGTEGVEEGLRSASRQFADHWASPDYRADSVVALFRRILSGM